MISFYTITIRDFMRLGRIEAIFPPSGIYLLRGENRDVDFRDSNGSGKSAFGVEAIAWCLYGKTLRGVSGDAVVRAGAKKAIVSLQFSMDRQWFNVQRSREASGGGTLRLLVDDAENFRWTDVSEHSANATQAKLEALLGMDFQTFCSTVVFGQASVFKFSSLSNRERKEILDEAAGARIYSRASEVARERRREADNLLAAAQARRDAIAEREEQLRRSLATAVARPSDEALLAELRYLQGEDRRLVKLSLKAKARRERAKAASEARRRAEADWLAVRNRAKSLRELTVQKQEQIDHLNSRGTCPLCGGKPKDREDVVKAVTAELNALIDDKLEAGAAVVEASQAKEKALVEENVALRRAEVAEAAKKDLEIVRGKIAQVRVEMDKPEQVKQMWRDALVVAETEARVAEVALRRASQVVETLRFLERSFSPDLASAAIEHAVPILNEAAALVSEEVTDGTTLVEFATTGTTKTGKVKDKLDLAVSSEVGAGSYAGSSEGEKAVADFIAGLAIQKMVSGSVECSLAVYDEALDHLDAAAGEKILAFLREEAKKKAIFVISHAEWLKDEQFDGTWTVVREGGLSQLVIAE